MSTIKDPAGSPAAVLTASSLWGHSGVYCKGIQACRVTALYLSRAWVPPIPFADVESADYVFYTLGILCVMESYQAIRYMLRQLKRFGVDASMRSRVALQVGGEVHRGEGAVTAAVPGKGSSSITASAAAPDASSAAPPRHSRGRGTAAARLDDDSGTCVREEDDIKGYTFESGPSSPTGGARVDGAPASKLAWYCNAFWRSVTRMPRSNSSFGSHSGGSDCGAQRNPHSSRHDSSWSNTRLRDCAGAEDIAVSLRGNEEVSVQLTDTDGFETSDVPLQWHVSPVVHSAASGSAPGLHAGDDIEGEEDEEEQTWEATPEMLKHYWKQLERSILTAPRRSPARVWRSLPQEMTTFEPDNAAVQAWCDDVIHGALHHGARLAPSWWSWLTSLEQVDSASPPASGGGVAGHCARLQRPVFAVPPGGCFAYHAKPSIDDFVLDEDLEKDSEKEEEEEENAVGEEVSDAAGVREAAAAAISSSAVDEDGSSLLGHLRDTTQAPPQPRPPVHGEGSTTVPVGPAGAAAAAAATATDKGSRGIPTNTSSSLKPVLRSSKNRRCKLKWEALFLIWFNIVEVSISSREIRALLLKASPPAFLVPAMTRDSGPTDLDVASTNLSLLWFWSLVQRVFETLVINRDVEKCEDDIEELAAYAQPLYIKCIARWPAPAVMSVTSEPALQEGLVGFVCGAQAAWVSLNTVLRKLLCLRRQLYVRNLWSLARYMYSNSKAKIISAALIAVTMTLSSRVSAAGRVVRERISNYIEKGEDAGGDPARGGLTPRYVAGLCAFELTRMAVQYVISNVTSEFIGLTASQRCEIVKMQLYEALCHTQLSFYEQHTYEEVEEIICYVSDMEGIDVQLHQFLFDAINVFVTLRNALQPFSYRSISVAAAVALTPYALRRTAKAVESRYVLLQREGYLPSATYAFEDDMQQGGDEDGNVLREGAMLRGDEIIAAIPQLRPYGADVRLVRWWNRYQQRRQRILVTHYTRSKAGKGGRGGYFRADSPHIENDTATQSPACSPRPALLTGPHRHKKDSVEEEPLTWSDRIRDFVGPWVTDEDVNLARSALVALLQLPHGKLLPGTGKALLSLSEWLLPMVASVYGKVWCGQRGLDGFQLLEGMQAIESVVDIVVQAFDTAEMVGYNAYKASMLERLLQPAEWEVISREEEMYVANFTMSAAAVRELADAQHACLGSASLTAVPNQGGSGRPVAGLSRGVTATIAEARSSAFYRRHYLRSVEVRHVRLRYLTPDHQQAGVAAKDIPVCAAPQRHNPVHSGSSVPTTSRSDSRLDSSPVTQPLGSEHEDYGAETVDDSLPTFSGDIILWSPAQQRGQFVCITGPNGSGKTALVNLLLALYVNARGGASSSQATPPHRGQLGAGSITLCFTPRTQSRKLRRGTQLKGMGASGTRTGHCMGGSASAHPGSAPRKLQRIMTTTAGIGDDEAEVSQCQSAPCTARPRFYTSQSCSAVNASMGENEAESVVSRDSARQYPSAVRDDDAYADTRVDLRAIPADVLRRYIFSYVPEVPTLFHGATVAQNISLVGYVSVATDTVMRRVLRCASLAQCDFIHQLPLGFLTRVSDNTGNTWSAFGQYSAGGGNTSVTRLSADQAKRLMLARAYFHGGEVLLLDEPTKEIEEESTSAKLYEGWRGLLDSGYLGGVVCATLDENLLRLADHVICLP
ncbi:hypothetical protein JKF63_07532 [Porcisia hertigi]|uniref:AAA+ ATPase domain-containing protein n=1 Tax=Porcisia hertigi TaxID=2761500 RepID=A0A836LGF8_9TRYP|nr:hypothetical protein JKF63_07532 [Porcisia hertigi]